MRHSTSNRRETQSIPLFQDCTLDMLCFLCFFNNLCNCARQCWVCIWYHTLTYRWVIPIFIFQCGKSIRLMGIITNRHDQSQIKLLLMYFRKWCYSGFLVKEGWRQWFFFFPFLSLFYFRLFWAFSGSMSCETHINVLSKSGLLWFPF